MKTGLVSTIIPVFNRPVLLREAVTSVLQQTYRPIEIIIIDDGSTDSTPEVICDLVKSSPDIIRSFRQENSGPGVARELGRQAANGEYIQYLDSDDLLLPSKFEVQVEALKANPKCGIAYGKTQFTKIGETASEVAHKHTGEKHEMLFPLLLVSRWWSTNTPLYRRALTDKMGAWLPLWNNEDWEYEARAASLGTKLCFCDDFVSVTRSGESEHHLCFQGSSDPKKLHNRAEAQRLIYKHALKGGVCQNQPEMQHFARSLFLLCRQCGAAGLVEDSVMLFNLAREASGEKRGNSFDFRLYRLVIYLLGWKAAGRITCLADRLRS